MLLITNIPLHVMSALYDRVSLRNDSKRNLRCMNTCIFWSRKHKVHPFWSDSEDRNRLYSVQFSELSWKALLCTRITCLAHGCPIYKIEFCSFFLLFIDYSLFLFAHLLNPIICVWLSGLICFGLLTPFPNGFFVGSGLIF